MMTGPEKQHEWLRQLVGRWEFDAECVTGPGEAPMKGHGVEVVRMIGDLWAVGESTGEMPGCGPMTSIITLGYDPARAKFVGTWIASVMSKMFLYEGVLDASGRVLPLDTTGPSMTDPTATARYQDVIELHPDGRRTMWSQMLKEDGSWVRFMTANYRRV